MTARSWDPNYQWGMPAIPGLPGAPGVPGSGMTGPYTSDTMGGNMMGGGPTGNTPWVPQGFGFNMQSAQGVLSGLQSIGSLWGAFQQAKLAKKAFNFQKDYANTNLRNSTQQYNTDLADRTASRAVVQGMSADQANAYLNKNRLVLPASAAPRGG